LENIIKLLPRLQTLNVFIKSYYGNLKTSQERFESIFMGGKYKKVRLRNGLEESIRKQNA